MEFELPLQLKQVLLHEYDGIAGHDELPALPCKPCVADILSQYVDQSNSEGLAFEVEVCRSGNPSLAPSVTSWDSLLLISASFAGGKWSAVVL